ncbi:MAG: hypothetical protein ABFS18_04220 [Thermodesulfobacteriota bacterium]
MKKETIPLWIALPVIQLRYRLFVSQIDGKGYLLEDGAYSEEMGYSISGEGEVNRTIELILETPDDSECKNIRFSKISVSINPIKKGQKKYSGEFIYTSREDNTNSEKDSLTLYLYIPDLTFKNFCREISSKKIHNLLAGISLEAEEESGVGRFGPPDLSDIVRITTSETMFSNNVKLTSLEANLHIQESCKDANK